MCGVNSILLLFLFHYIVFIRPCQAVFQVLFDVGCARRGRRVFVKVLADLNIEIPLRGWRSATPTVGGGTTEIPLRAWVAFLPNSTAVSILPPVY